MTAFNLARLTHLIFLIQPFAFLNTHLLNLSNRFKAVKKNLMKKINLIAFSLSFLFNFQADAGNYNPVSMDYLHTYVQTQLSGVRGTIPAGGTTNQVLIKNSDTDYDSSWSTLVSPPTYTLGQEALGGVVVVLDDTSMHGLVMSGADVGDSPRFNGDNERQVKSYAFGDALGAGRMNTALIIAAQAPTNPTSPQAALVCVQYTGGNYGDWYLPSYHELNLISAYLDDYDTSVTPGLYWSSTEHDVYSANAVNLNSGAHQMNLGKDSNANVRCVRTF